MICRMQDLNIAPLRRLVSAAILILPLGVVCAASLASAEPDDAPPGRGGILSLLPEPSTTKHSIALAGETLNYRATAGTLPIREAAGNTAARIFYVAYSASPQQHDRPLTFVFNGGPGAASAYLNLGAMGPKIVALNPDGSLPPPPSRLIDNPDSWLRFTDLVFVDPVGTGYSRAASPKEGKAFWGVDRDAKAMAAFIRLYLERNARATSPIFLVGESYGGLRAAKLAELLPHESGIAVSGMVLISPSLEFSLIFGQEPGQILPDALALPSMAAVNLYDHGVIDRQALGEKLKSVTQYALTDYLTDLAAGPVATRDRASQTVAQMIGLPQSVVRRHDGDVSLSLFAKLHAKPGRRLSRYDGTVSGPDITPSSPYPDGPDPILDRTVPVFTSAYIDYLRHDLGYKTDVSYRLLNGHITGQWDYGNKPNDQGYAGAMDELQAGRALNPSLQVLIACGYTDLVTPFLDQRYLVDQMPPLEGAAPIEIEDYLGGHMMYLRRDSRHALADDAAALYARALEAR
jgi:carboxypeptidase C (cathepsin A)